MFERILVPLDGSPLAEQALPFALELALKFNSQIILLRATIAETEALRETITEPTLAMPEIPIDVAKNLVESERTAASAYLERSAGGLEAAGVIVQTRVIEGGAAWAILTIASEIDASVVVMASHGRGGLGRLVFGSVADQVLRESTVPVLLIRVKE